MSLMKPFLILTFEKYCLISYLLNSDISIYLWLQNKITATFPQIEYINDKIFIEFGKVGHFILVVGPTDLYFSGAVITLEGKCKDCFT